jgi:hypothetical protein
MAKPTLAQRTSFKTWLRKFKSKFANTTIPEFYIDAILSEKAVGISTTDDVRVIPFDNFETVDISSDEANETLFYLPALTNDRVTVSFGSTSVLLTFVGEDQGVTKDGSTYTLNQNIPIARGRALTIKGLGGALLQSSSVPIYDITPSATNVNEGGTINFVVTTSGVNIGTTLYYNTESGISGTTAVGADLISPNSGSFAIVGDGTSDGGIATVTRTIILDGVTEGPETFRTVILTDSTTVGVVTRTDDITINDVVALYSVGVSTTVVNEGSSVEFTVNATGIAAGTTLYFSTSGTTVAADFTDNSLTGSFNIVGNGTTTGGIATFSRALVAEPPGSEGTENFNVTIRTGSTSGAAVTTTPTITVNDVFPIYDIDFVEVQTGIATDTFEEGQLFDVTINTQNVAVGTQLRVDFEEEPGTGSNVNYRDLGLWNFGNDQLQSSSAKDVDTVGSATTFRSGAFYDWRSNENDVFRFVVRERSSGSSGTALTSKTLTVTDVDLLFDLTVDKTTVNEGDTLNLTFGNPRHPVTGISTNMPEGPAYATIEIVSGAINDDDFNSSFSALNHEIQTGTYSGYGSSSSTTIGITADFVSEGVEVFYVAIRGHSYTDPIIIRSPDITILDTSTVPGAQANGLTFGPVIVNRDGGTAADATDWYKICKIDDLPEGSSIALFIDTSGSMTLQTVRASYDAFVAKLNEKNITITTVTNSNEDWITPFLVDLP